MGERKSLWQRLPTMFEPQPDILSVLEDHNDAAQSELAAHSDTPPEALFYLATNGSTATRRTVAANPSTPAQANRHLADDEDDEVRVQLARKIGQLLPNLPDDASQRMRDLTMETLERLAHDTLPRVRQALAEEIKALDCVPPKIVRKLARDVERAVAAPVLEYSPLLSDSELIEIISSAQSSFALLAIAKRRPLRASVSEAIASAMDEPAVAALLVNSTAQIRSQTLDKIVQHAARIKDWHLPLVLRNDLSQRAIRRLATFVSKSLVEMLAAKHDLDEKTRDYLKKKIKERIDSGEVMGPKHERGLDLEALKKSGKLDDAFVEGAIESGSRDTVVSSLALLAGIAPEIAARIFQTSSAKPITALVWRAGLSMRVAFKIQTFLLRLPAGETLPARDGIRFPMNEDEMRWHLNYFGVQS